MIVTAVRDEEQEVQPSLGHGVAVLIMTSRSHLPGIVHDVQPHALSILVKEPLAEGSKIAIEFGALVREAEVVACRPNGGRYELCVAIPEWKARDLRAAERFPISQEVRICRSNSDLQTDAVIVDLSSHGVGLEVSTPLEDGEVITVESVSGIAFGTVRHCKRLFDGRCRAGVEVFHIMAKQGASSE